MKDHVSFETAYARLEAILETLNSGQVSLEDALKLYEEADTLIVSCHKKLVSAEQKVQTLIKNREGNLALDATQRPILEDFIPVKEAHLSRNLEE